MSRVQASWTGSAVNTTMRSGCYTTAQPIHRCDTSVPACLRFPNQRPPSGGCRSPQTGVCNGDTDTCRRRGASWARDDLEPPCGLEPQFPAYQAGVLAVVRRRQGWNRWESNPRHPTCKASALPAELRPQKSTAPHPVMDPTRMLEVSRPRRPAGSSALVETEGIEPSTFRVRF